MDTQTDTNMACQAARDTWRWRLTRRLFPMAPEPRKDSDPRTFVTTHIYVGIDWRDRFRVLWSGRMFISVVTYTDVEVKDAESLSAFSVQPR